MDKVLSTKQVSEILGVCLDTAAKIIVELPHADISGRLDAKHKSYVIFESVLEGYLRGQIKRIPAEYPPRPSDMEKTDSMSKKKATSDPEESSFARKLREAKAAKDKAVKTA